MRWPRVLLSVAILAALASAIGFLWVAFGRADEGELVLAVGYVSLLVFCGLCAIMIGFNARRGVRVLGPDPFHRVSGVPFRRGRLVGYTEGDAMGRGNDLAVAGCSADDALD